MGRPVRASGRPDYKWAILAAAFAILFFGGGARFAFGLVLKPMAEELGGSRSSLSLAVTAFMVVSALALPVVGRLVDRHSLRWVLTAGALAAGVGTLLVGQVTALWQVFILYGGIYAIGNAAIAATPVGVMISRWFADRRGMANSAAIAGNAVGQLVIITALASLVVWLGWRASFTALGLAHVIVVVPLALLVVRSRPPADEASVAPAPSHTPREAATADGRPLKAVMTSRRLWQLVVIYAICGFQDFLVTTHIVAFAQDQGVGTVLAGNLLALMGLLGLAGVLLSGLIADASGAARPTVLCFLMRIGIFAFIPFFQDTTGIVAFALLYGFTFLITAPLTVVFSANIFGQARLGTISGLISSVHQIFGGLGAFVGAYIFDRTGSYDDAFWLMLVLSVVGVGVTMLVRERLVRPAPMPA